MEYSGIFFQAEDGIRDFWMWLASRRVLFRSDAASGEWNSLIQSAAQDIYGAQQGAQQGPSNPGPDNNDGGVTDVDFEEVK